MAEIKQDKDVGKVDDWTPRPDPTVLTTQAILRELEGLRALSFTRIDCAKELSDTRFAGMDKAITLLQVITDRQPQEVDRKITSLQKLHEEKFSSIDKQFMERDVRTEQTARDSKVAVDAALQAAKEAVGEQNKSSSLAISKSESATAKQLDQLGLLITTTNQGVNDKIEDIKERLTRIEGTSTGRSDLLGWIFGGVGVLVGLISAVYYMGHLVR